jgi:type II secretory pathway pseudopilin PulG
MKPITSLVRARLRGTSLLEVLIAMGIMALMIVGTLQMFFVTLDISRNASNRTLLTYKAQQVAEQIRYIHYVAQQYGTTQVPSWASSMGIGQVMTQGSYSLPYTSANLGDPTIGGPYWGPATQSYPQGTNIIEGAQMPYKLSYDVSALNTQTGSWVVTVTAQPVQTSSSAGQAGNNLYKGTNLTQKVKYVFNIGQ